MSQGKAKYGDAPPSIHFNLDAILASRGINKNEAARKIGVTKNTLYSILKQPTAIRLDTLLKICLAFDVDPGDLFILEN